MNHFLKKGKHLVWLALVPWLLACKQEPPIYYPNANVSPAPNLGPAFVAGTYFSLEPHGYEQVEFFFRGEAKSYENVGPITPDGKWNVTPVDSEIYKTRMIIHRPTNPDDFNGTVLVEWMNVTGGVDTATDWILLHNEIMRKGYAWVGISAQRIGVEGGQTPLPTPIGMAIPLKLINTLRYATLSHPGDSFSYDIYSQAGRAIKSPTGLAPLGELEVERLIAIGESQSATRLITYYNAFEKDNSDVYDGYYIHSRLGNLPDFGGASAPLSQEPQEYITTADIVTLRDDLDKPVINVQTETDLFKLEAYANRQPDSDTFRLWEIAGTAHADLYLTTVGGFDQEYVRSAQIYQTPSPSVFLGICPDLINTAPQHSHVGAAALRGLDTWIRDGIAPASAEPIAINEEDDDVVRDEFGNALGGVRSPYMDVPIATMSGDNSSIQNEADICFLYGYTELLDRATLQQLYSSQDDYINKLMQSSEELVTEGFLLQEDADLILSAAEQSLLTPFY